MLFPVPEKYLQRILDEGKDVFVKYLPKSTSKLEPGHKIIFYASQGSKHIAGEAVIADIEFLTPEEIVSRYSTRLFITKGELEQYTKGQPLRSSDKPLFVAIMKRIKKYAKRVVFTGHITMTGSHVTLQYYRQIVNQAH